jgi:hypothetical protein
MFMYHLYYGKEGKNRRRLVTEDWQDDTFRLGKISGDEITFVLSEPGVVGEGRLGTERTLTDYGNFCGLDFYTGEIAGNFCGF